MLFLTLYLVGYVGCLVGKIETHPVKALFWPFYLVAGLLILAGFMLLAVINGLRGFK